MPTTERGEEQPDPSEPSGGTPEDREDAERLEQHSRPASSPTDAEAVRPGDGEPGAG